MTDNATKINDSSSILALDPAAVLDTVSPCTHAANAQRIARNYAKILRYVLGEGWIQWTGQFWRPDPTKDDALTMGAVSKLSKRIREEAKILYAHSAEAQDTEKRKSLHQLADERWRWAEKSESIGVISAGLTLAKNIMLLTHDKINTDPWLFNCQNGTINLKTGEIYAHNSADFITQIAPVEYVKEAQCPTWKNFLLEVFDNDQSMVDFIQRGLGSCLTGIVQDRALFFLYGPLGNNGKTTLVECFRDLLGLSGEGSFGYARKVDVATFMKSKNDEDNKRKSAQLVGARFVFSSETDTENRLNEQLIKDMTGGDTMEARKLYKEAFNFKPTFKPWMYGNHKPEIRGTDEALWDRVKLIPFEISFAGRINKKLPEELREELSGILNWAIEGCLKWQEIGLKPPESVVNATKEYRIEQDVIGRFIQECCETGKEEEANASALYSTYRKWCVEEEIEHKTQTAFGIYLSTHGFPSDGNATGRGVMRKGITIRDPTAPQKNPDYMYIGPRSDNYQQN